MRVCRSRSLESFLSESSGGLVVHLHGPNTHIHTTFIPNLMRWRAKKFARVWGQQTNPTSNWLGRTVLAFWVSHVRGWMYSQRELVGQTHLPRNFPSRCYGLHLLHGWGHLSRKTHQTNDLNHRLCRQSDPCEWGGETDRHIPTSKRSVWGSFWIETQPPKNKGA